MESQHRITQQPQQEFAPQFHQGVAQHLPQGFVQQSQQQVFQRPQQESVQQRFIQQSEQRFIQRQWQEFVQHPQQGYVQQSQQELSQNTQQAFIQQPQQDVNQHLAIMLSRQPNMASNFFPKIVRSQLKVVSALQIIIGITCIVLGLVVLLVGGETSYDSFAFTGYGIWIGAYFILVGGISIGSVISGTKSFIISAMVLNIICCASWCVVDIAFGSVGVSVAADINYYSYCKPSGNPSLCRKFDAKSAIDGILLLAGIAEFILSIWSAVLCCKTVCDCCKPEQRQYVYIQPPAANQSYLLARNTEVQPPSAIGPTDNRSEPVAPPQPDHPTISGTAGAYVNCSDEQPLTDTNQTHLDEP